MVTLISNPKIQTYDAKSKTAQTHWGAGGGEGWFANFDAKSTTTQNPNSLCPLEGGGGEGVGVVAPIQNGPSTLYLRGTIIKKDSTGL